MTLIPSLYEMVENACRQETNYFGYEVWTYHIVSVIKYAKQLAQKIGADEEIVEIAALLHDYASLSNYRLYVDHHIHGAVMAEILLQRFDYPIEKIERVKHCIIAHRGSTVIAKESKEALCVADADGMAHFDSMVSLLHLAFSKHNMSIDESIHWLTAKLEKSWSKLSPAAKEIIAPKYEASKLILSR